MMTTLNGGLSRLLSEYDAPVEVHAQDYGVDLVCAETGELLLALEGNPIVAASAVVEVDRDNASAYYARPALNDAMRSGGLVATWTTTFTRDRSKRRTWV